MAPSLSPSRSSSAVPQLSFPSPSTSDAGKGILATATAAADSIYALEVANRIQQEPNWRHNYHKHAVDHVRVCADASPEKCLAVARAGLDRLYGTFRFDSGGESSAQKISLREALNASSKNNEENRSCFVTGQVVGTQPRRSSKTSSNVPNLVLPVRGKTLCGAQVHAQMDQWAQKGVIEPDTAAAVRTLQQDDLNLRESDWVFCIMGAGAAMGPLETLLSLGATIIAVDLPIPAVWERLFKKVEASTGNLLFPMKEEGTSSLSNSSRESTIDKYIMARRAGCNLLTEIPQLIQWLIKQCPSKRLVLGSYAYLDSAAFVKVSLAMDAVASETLKERPNSALAYLCSPTDVFAIPPGARNAAVRNNDKGGTAFEHLISTLAPAGRVLDPNVVGPTRDSAIPLVDALVLQQGPNYFLAKRLQHWRAMVAQAEGAVVSSNVAPASNTKSVLKNKLLAAAYAGAHHFRPIEIFDPETSNVLMTYLLLHDLKTGATHNREEQMKRAGVAPHPLNLFATTPVHNGIWRCGFQIRSLLELVLAYYLVDKCKPAVVALGALGGTAIYMRSRL